MAEDKRWWGSVELFCLRKAQRDQWKKMKGGRQGQVLSTETEDRQGRGQEGYERSLTSVGRIATDSAKAV